MQPVARTLYDVLGVPPTADAEELRRAYLSRARESHPDRYVDAPPADRGDAERRMRDVNEAWRVLGNPRRRRRYDLELMPAERFVTRTDGTMPQEIVFAVCEQLPREDVTETNPCGPESWFVSFTAFAVDGPLFTTVTINVRLLPTATAGTAATVTPTSAAGVTVTE